MRPIQKQPSETVLALADFTNACPSYSGARVMSAYVEVLTYADGTDVTYLMAPGDVYVDGNQVGVNVEAGEDNTGYKVCFVATLSNGQLLRIDQPLLVRGI